MWLSDAGGQTDWSYSGELLQEVQVICCNLQVRPRGQKRERSNGPSRQTPGLVPRNIRQISFHT